MQARLMKSIFIDVKKTLLTMRRRFHRAIRGKLEGQGEPSSNEARTSFHILAKAEEWSMERRRRDRDTARACSSHVAHELGDPKHANSGAKVGNKRVLANRSEGSPLAGPVTAVTRRSANMRQMHTIWRKPNRTPSSARPELLEEIEGAFANQLRFHARPIDSAAVRDWYVLSALGIIDVVPRPHHRLGSCGYFPSANILRRESTGHVLSLGLRDSTVARLSLWRAGREDDS